MTKKLPRLTFRCWKCLRTYTLLPHEITEEQTLIVACPYCGVEGIVQVAPYKKRVISTMRELDSDDDAIGFEYVFPDVIPTESPE